MGTNGDFLGLNFMGTTSKTFDVIPQVPKSSHNPPPPRQSLTHYTARVGDSNNGYSNELRHLSVECTGDIMFKLHYSTLLKIIDCKRYATTGKRRSCHSGH